MKSCEHFSSLGFGARVALVAALLVGTAGCVTLQQHKDLVAQEQADVDKLGQDNAALRAELDAVKQRLDNALKANADTGSDVLSSKARLNDLTGQNEQLSHQVEEMRKDLTATRSELVTQIDELKRAQPAAPAPPPVTVPADKAAHFAALDQAYARKDWPAVRILGHEYATKYPQDDLADDALYLTGDGDLQDNRPSSALGEFNRLLKIYPRSNRLGPTLMEMGTAYLALHDCDNAKLAFSAAQERFPRERFAVDARKRLGEIAHPPAGMCAPQT
jgi:TolA-binding protein